MTDHLPRHSPLTTGWTVEGHGRRVPSTVRDAGPIDAAVPGSVHTDLLAAGLIDDPYLDDNERLQAWIGQSDWTYRLRFAWAATDAERHDLVFDGLDTVAAIELNGLPLAETRNMHRRYRFDVTDRLVAGVNDLVVRFSSPIAEADAASLRLGARPHVNAHPYNAIRKMACSFGWDWGPDTATSGIWRSVRLESWACARLVDPVISASVDGAVPTLSVAVGLARTVSRSLVLRVAAADARGQQEIPAGETDARVELVVPGAALWYPTGHGEPALHEVVIELVDGSEVIDRITRRVGFRSVEVRHTPDEHGSGFEILVNDERVLVRGVNWIPDDAFPHRVDRARYAARLDQAQFAHVNLVRVWGGGVYESDDFYDLCDERGILTWQDFLFACAAYAEEEPLRSEIEAEARDNVARLGAHPSLIVLNGNNENAWARQDWGWGLALDGRTWGAGYYDDLLPAIVAELAPQIAYTPASPFSPDPAAPQNDPTRGTTHIWDLWNEKDHPHYRDSRPRFVSEFGWQGPPTFSTLTSSISDDPLTPESPGMLVHQKAIKGNEKLTDGLVRHLPVPDSIDDWHWAMSLNQAVAVRTAIEWFRSLTPHCTGSIMWQLNDCWPVTSWAAVDGNGRAKPLLHALRAAHAPRLLTVQPVQGAGLEVVAVNDTATAWEGSLRLRRASYSGAVLAESTSSIRVEAREVERLRVPFVIASAGEAGSEILTADLDDVHAAWYFADYRESDLGDPMLTADAERTADGWIVDVVAGAHARDVTLLVDRVAPAARVDRALVDLAGGERVRFIVTGAAEASAEDFRRADVLRSANDLLRRR